MQCVYGKQRSSPVTFVLCERRPGLESLWWFLYDRALCSEWTIYLLVDAMFHFFVLFWLFYCRTTVLWPTCSFFGLICRLKCTKCSSGATWFMFLHCVTPQNTAVHRSVALACFFIVQCIVWASKWRQKEGWERVCSVLNLCFSSHMSLLKNLELFYGSLLICLGE